MGQPAYSMEYLVQDLAVLGLLMLVGRCQFSAEIGISVNFKYLISVRVKCYSLSSSGLQVLHKVDYLIAVGRSRVLREAGTSMHCIRYIRSDDIIQEVKLPQNCSLVEALIKRQSSSVTSKNLG